MKHNPLLRPFALLGLAAILGATACAATGTSGNTAVECPQQTHVPAYEVTIGIAVKAPEEALAWYESLVGREVETTRPVEGVIELRINDNLWLQLFAAEETQLPGSAGAPTPTILRLATPDIDVDAKRLGTLGIEIGEIVRIPGVVAYAEFADPFGNAVGLYQLLQPEN